MTGPWSPREETADTNTNAPLPAAAYAYARAPRTLAILQAGVGLALATTLMVSGAPLLLGIAVLTGATLFGAGRAVAQTSGTFGKNATVAKTGGNILAITGVATVTLAAIASQDKTPPSLAEAFNAGQAQATASADAALSCKSDSNVEYNDRQEPVAVTFRCTGR